MADSLLCQRLGAWALSGALLLGPVGCLLPQDDTPLIHLNRPPRIAEELLGPAKRIRRVSLAGVGCASDTLEAPVEDFDVDDVLTYRFYVDYDANDPSTIFADDHTLRNPERTVVRKEKPQFKVDISSTGTLFTSGTHLIELWVTDGAAVAQSRAPPFTANPDGGVTFHPYATSYAWQVQVTATCE